MREGYGSHSVCMYMYLRVCNYVTATYLICESKMRFYKA